MPQLKKILSDCFSQVTSETYYMYNCAIGISKNIKFSWEKFIIGM